MNIVNWDEESIVDIYAEGKTGGYLKKHFDLTEIHGETEFIRQGFLVSIEGEWALVTRTLNSNRARAISILDGSTIWLSPDITGPPEKSYQISQLGFGDIDEDGIPEVLLASYNGDVICINGIDGSIKWHVRLDYHINNPRLDIKKATPGAGLNLALTVGNDFRWTRNHARPRINMVNHPSLMVLGPGGEEIMVAKEYDSENGNGHNTWMFDIDGDGICEICCSGHERIHWFRHDGTHLFSLPCRGKGNHPDSLLAYDWLSGHQGREIIYLDGTEGIAVSSSKGEILRRLDIPERFASHLQELRVFPSSKGTSLLAENIRSRDSKLLYFDHQFNLRWAAHAIPDLSGAHHLDWDGDGRQEIICGSHGRGLFNPEGALECSLHMMKEDGEPVYWHRWRGETMCVPLAIGDLDGNGNQEVVVSVGTKGGPEGRFSLASGHHERIMVIGLE